MTAPSSGQYGSTHYESPESQALGSITLESYSKVYDDQGKFLSKLASDTSYMAAMMRKMQGGIDKANENFIQQFQDMINDVLVLLGGGDSLSGLDFGDLKYVIQAIGALLGFGDGTGGVGLPINLYTAAWHFVSTYIFPVENFKEVINEIIDAAIAGVLGLFGTVPVLGQALEQLAVIISNIRDSILPLTTALDALFTAFGGDASTGDLGDFSPLWTALMNLFGALTGPEVEALVPIFQVFATWTTPFIDLLTQIVNDLTPYVDDLASLFDALTPIITEITDLVTAFEPYLDELSSFLEALMPIFTAIAGLASMFGFGSTPGGFDPTSAVTTFITSFLNPSGLLTAILDPSQLLNAQNLYNIIPPSLLALIPFSNVGSTVQNLLANPSFEGAASVQGSGIWLWDAVAGNTSPGSTYVVADGSTRQLISNAIPVSPSDKINTSIFSKWSGVTHTGNAFKVQILEILDYVVVNTVDVVTSGSIVTNQPTWTQFNGAAYTVPTSGVDQIALQIERESTVSTGTIWFDDATLSKSGLMNPSWLSGVFGGSTLATDIMSFAQNIFTGITGGTYGGTNILADIMTALSSIPFGNILGIGGPSSLGGSVQSTWDQWVSGLVGVLGSGASLGDLFNIGQQVSSNATLGQMGWGILGIRSNKPFFMGLLPTGISNIPLPGLTSSTAPIFGITQSTAPMAYLHIDEGSTLGVVSWYGSGLTNITNFFVNIFKVATDGTHTLVHQSADIIGAVNPATNGVNIYSLPTPLAVQPGEVYGVELAVRGTGTYNVIGATSWLTNHTAVFPKTLSSVRNSGTSAPPSSIASGSVTYNGNIPFIERAVTSGTFDNHDPYLNQFLTAQTGTVLAIPDWANFVEVVVVGGGGHGHSGGTWGIGGNGGAAGTWAEATWAKGTDYSAGQSITLTVGAGSTGSNGHASTAAITGHTVSGAGGTDGPGYQGGAGPGASPGNVTYGSPAIPYSGGAQQNNMDQDGSAPGGGGGGGDWIGFGAGGNGAVGAVFIRFRQT